MLKRLRRALGQPPQGSQPWIVAEDNPTRPDPLPSFRLFAILGTWLEADVVAATVRNALAQGCERVYVVDNDSSDDTAGIACAAGATLARSFSSESYDETLRLRLMNEVVAEVSTTTGTEHVWWLWLDADEFHHGPRGTTLREHLGTLDRRFRIVGARVFNHFPHGKPEYLPGFHPLDFQPLCQEFRVAHCAAGHWKHPLQRFDRSGPPVISEIGFHKAESADVPLREPSIPVFMHHFQYRDEERTRHRLEQLCRPDGTGKARIALTDARWGGSGISKRFRTLTAVYAQRWDRVENLSRRGDPIGVSPVPWERTVGAEDARYAVWYPADALERALAAGPSRPTVDPEAQTRS